MNREEFHIFCQKHIDAEEKARQFLLEAIKLGETPRKLKDMQEVLGEEKFTHNSIEYFQILQIQTLRQSVSKAALKTIYSYSKRMSKCFTTDAQTRKLFWQKILSSVDIPSMVRAWQSENDTFIPKNEEVLKQAQKYAMRILGLTIAFNGNEDESPQS